MRQMAFFLTMAALLGAHLASGCQDGPKEFDLPDGSVDADSDADADVDGDTDSDGDADSDADSDADADTDADADSDTDADTDADTDWSGDCQSADDCPGGDCLRIPDEEGGWWTCVYAPPTEVDGPSENPEVDACESSSECDDGCGCYLVEEYYPGFFMPHNECLCDACDESADCDDPESQECIPAGAFGEIVDTCLWVACHVNGDCTEGAQGVCMPYYDGCSSLDPLPVAGKACHYADDTCLPGGDPCPVEYEMCAPDTDGVGFSCQSIACPG